MTTMNRYTIYCTEAQTKKALELDAPLTEIPFRTEMKPDTCNKYGFIHLNNTYFVIPTTEQMIGWLRKEHNIHPRIDCEGSENYVVKLQFINSSKDLDVVNKSYKGIIGHPGFPSPEEATIAAIDAALEYLTNNKK